MSPQKPASPVKRTRVERDLYDMLETERSHTAKRFKSDMFYESPENVNDGHSQTTEMPNTPPISASGGSHDGWVAQTLEPSVTSQPASDSSSKAFKLGVDIDDESAWEEMKEQMLLKERERSDPKSTWLKEQEWLNWMLDKGGALDAKELPRFIAALGDDIAPETSDLDA